MNAPARILQDLFYLMFSAIIRFLGGLKSPGRVYGLAQLLGELRTRFGYIGAGWSREKYLQTIRTVFPGIDSTRAERYLKAYWINHQKRFAELFLVSDLNSENLSTVVEFEGLERLDQALQRGKGIILPVPHIGNERLHHIVLAAKGYPMAVISSQYGDHGPYARKIKLEAATRFHEVGHPGDARWLLRMLKKNAILQVASDAEADAHAVEVDFLGQKLLLPTGWVRLAGKTGATVFPSVLLRQADNRHQLTIFPEFELVQLKDGKVDLQGSVQEYMKIVEDIFLKYPEFIDWMSLSVRIEETRRAKAS